MAGLIAAYLYLILFLPPHVQPTLLSHIDTQAVWIAVPVMITSYGFHIIIPTLTTYLHHDAPKLRFTLFIGSLIPFLVYALWEFLILGVIPLDTLIASWQAGETGAGALSHILQNRWIGAITSAFSFFAIITSFLGVSLSLSDFLSDGLHMKRFRLGRAYACLLTFIPPLLFVLAYQRGFLLALQFAGIFVAILLCILPALMAWKLPAYKPFLKRVLLVAVIVVSLGVIGWDILEQAGVLHNLISDYFN
jgi:tyrosine-specific transport protein